MRHVDYVTAIAKSARVLNYHFKKSDEDEKCLWSSLEPSLGSGPKSISGSSLESSLGADK